MITEKDFNNVVENIRDGLYIVDYNMKIVFWNKAAEKITGFKSEEVLGSSCSDNILNHVDGKGNNLCKGICPLRRTIFDGEHRQLQLYLHHKEGHVIPITINTFPRYNEGGKIIGGLELFSTLPSEIYMEAQIEKLSELSLIDSLTELSNKRFIENEIKSCLDQRKRHGISFGILFFDCDDFADFNDEYGRKTGDQILKEIAKTSLNSIRISDKVSRWDKDKFLGIFQNLSNRGLYEMAERLRVLIKQTRIKYKDRFLSVSVSIGGTLAEHDDDLHSLIAKAEKLLQKCKETSKNQVIIENFSPNK